MLTLKVDGMSCDHCKQTITKAIRSIDSEADVRIDLKQGIVGVESRANRESIEAAIVESGFDLVK